MGIQADSAPNSGVLGLYYDRWQALDTLMGELETHYLEESKLVNEKGDPQLHRGDVIVRLLGCLRAFAEGQFKFFYFGFQHNHPARHPTDPLLQPSDEFPAEDVLTGIINQVGHDLALIERAADQRRAMGDTMRNTLEKADTLASLALQPAIKYGIIDRPDTVLTYLDKAAEFYHLPYARIALISIPFTCAYGPENNGVSHQDFLAIPHEAGHYVYRNLVGKAEQDLKDLRAFSGVPPAYQGWIKGIFEEMCADIYGCLVAGPVIARDFQDVCLANGQLDFGRGDNQHPNPALRPLIYCQVLDSAFVRRLTKKEEDWQPFAAVLAKRWDQQLYRRHVTDFVVNSTRLEGQDTVQSSQPYNIAKSISPATSQHPVPVRGPVGNLVHQTLATIFNSIFYYLDTREPFTEYEHTLSGWYVEMPDATNIEALLGRFNTDFEQIVNLHQDDNLVEKPKTEWCGPSDDRPSPHTTKAWRQWADSKNHILGQLPLEDWPMTKEILAGEVKDPDLMRAGTWGSILYAGGWTTSGPGVDPGHPGVDPGHPGVDPGHPQGY